ncbi:hypothetical protein [Brevifollis gellanilyticus]|uniref:Uncharacterized protein n=1 Tax=Brevifollis gellanilyticus TaxID=748831 RepID=A0A512MDI2_9BACT|nr:hypothetical protein [Brevifollis gellanilyticus]GEP44796.1 hypothetical protein BGE01nite_40870 [Brevifollis gellanilyticus]
MSGINVQKFRETSLLGTVSIEQRNDKAEVVPSGKKFGGKALDWLAGGILKNTDWGSERLTKLQSQQKLAFNLFVGALKQEYGKGVGEKQETNKTNIDKAIREAFGGKIPKLNAKNVAKMESIAKSFNGQGDAQSLKRNLVVRWWVSSGLDHPGHAAAGIRNRTVNPNAQDKYVSFWPGDSAGGKGEILDALRGKNQEGHLSETARDDYGSEIADRTESRLEDSRVTRAELREVTPKANKFFADLRGIQDDDDALDNLEDAVEDYTDHIDILLDTNGDPEETQTLQGRMKLNMHEALTAFENEEISFEECMSKLKEASNNYTSKLLEYAKFEPKARQKAYVDTDTNQASWGLKAEKFHLPLAGRNGDATGDKFVYFGLNESSMVERYDSLQKDGAKATERSSLLSLTPEEVADDWNGDGVDYLMDWAEDLRDCYDPTSKEYQDIQKCMDDGSVDTLPKAQKFLGDLQTLLNQQGHVMPYKMVSHEENCAGYITNLMERGGAKAFASKPTPKNIIATSPNDTASFAKKVLSEVDRLNKLSDEIMTHYDANYDPTKDQIKDQCPPKVWNAFKALMDMSDTNPISHEELMKKTKTLVEGISNAKDMPRNLGALLLMTIQPLYGNAGNPIP